VSDFRDLDVWRCAHELALMTYRVTEALPGDERYALRNQLRRAAAAVSANIAEGNGRGGRREFAHFLRVARGSLFEVQALMLLARDLGQVEESALADLWPLAERVARMLGALEASCRRRSQDG